MFKKLLSILLISFLIIPNYGKNIFVFAEEDEDLVEERSNREKCIEDKDAEACKLEIKERNANKNRIEQEIAEKLNNQEEAYELAAKYEKQAEEYQKDIDDLKVQIDELEKRIAELEIQIAENEKKVEELNSRVKDCMVNYQRNMHFNGYLEFILGSKSFTDMLRRVYGVKAVSSKDKADREEYIQIITTLTADKKELDESKVKLDEDYDSLVTKQAEYLEMKKFYQDMVAQIEEELQKLTEEKNRYENFSDLIDIIKELDIPINDGFVAAVHGSHITEGVWHYSDDFLGGTWHTGIDYAAGKGTQIHAPAGGVIIRADSSCVTENSLYNACGEWIAGGGNQVYLMCEVNGVVYGFMFFHLSRVDVSYGDYVMQDEVIGAVGSTGSSTGPHCHIEMYKLGFGTLSEFLKMNWNSTFSCGRHENAYNNRCSLGDVPCICDPRDYLPG